MARFNNGLVFTNDKCIGCNKCLASCPVMGANVSCIKDGKLRVDVDSRKCIGCGECIKQCVQGARGFKDDSELFFEDLANGEKISVIISPSFYLIYEKAAPQILGYLRSLGVDKIYDESLGVEISMWAHVTYLRNHRNEPFSKRAFIANTCPVVIKNIERYYPDLLAKIVPVHSSVMCTSIYVNRYMEDNNRIAYISSCISGKENVDYNISFFSLMEHLKNVDIESFYSVCDLKSDRLGNVMALNENFIKCMSHFFDKENQLIELDGKNENTFKLISFYASGKLSESDELPLLVDVKSCEIGCISGSGAEKNIDIPTLIHKNFLKLRKKCSEIFDEELSHEECTKKLLEKFSKLDIQDFIRKYKDQYKQPCSVPENILEEIYSVMGKDTEEKKKINCGACGFTTCREMVASIALGYSRKERCIHFMNDEMIRHLYTDSLTGILNQTAFVGEVEKHLLENLDRQFIICSGDVNRFKVINDLYGSDVGDSVLIEIVNRLKKVLGNEAVYARFSGGQFLLFLEYTLENMQRLRSIKMFDCSSVGIDFPVSMRFGIYVTNKAENESIMSMISRANLAMDKAVSVFQNTYTIFSSELRKTLALEASISTEMPDAMRNNEFVLWFQPQYAAKDKKLVGAEVLCRWFKPDGSMVSPGVFIPIAEKNGFIRYLDQKIWQMAFAQLRKWIDEGKDPVPLSINISRVSLGSDALIYAIKRLQGEYEVPASLVHFEVTESAYMDDQSNIIERIGSIRDMGFKIAMDDFGNGYSSLNALKDIPIDILKLDMGFLRSVENSDKGGKIISSLIRMAQLLHVKTVAEGVEYPIHETFLREIGCDVIQGYLYARPMPCDKYEEVLKEENNSKSCRNANSEVEKENDYLELTNFFKKGTNEYTIFERFLGPASLIEYCNENITVLKCNRSFFELFGIEEKTVTEAQDILKSEFFVENKKKLCSAINEAFVTKKESRCLVESLNFKTKEKIKIKIFFKQINEAVDKIVLFTRLEKIEDCDLL